MKKSRIFLFILLFLFFSLINYLVPYTNDDLAWGSIIGKARLNNFFANYNGRYLGNLLVLLLTRFKILKSIIIGFSFTLLCYLINELISKNVVITLTISILLLTLPKEIFNQTVVWTSGFSNYVPPVILLLLFVNLYVNYYKKSHFYNFSILILGIVSTLFMEHLTIYCLILSVLSFFYSYKKNKKQLPTTLYYLIGVIIGSITMFSNGAYHNIAIGTDWYRHIPNENIIMYMLVKYFTMIYKYLFFKNSYILITISFSFYVLYKNSRKNILLKTSTLFTFLYSCYSLISSFISITNLTFIYIQGILTLVYIGAVLIEIYYLNLRTSLKKQLYFILGSILVIVAPLFIVNPLNARCFFPTYILLIIFSALLLKEAINYINPNRYIYIKTSSIFILLSVIAFYTFIFFSIYITNIKSLNIIKSALKDNCCKIILPKNKYESFLYYPYPSNKANLARFKLFYKIPQDVIIEFKGN